MNCEQQTFKGGGNVLAEFTCGNCAPCLAGKATSAIQTPLTDDEIDEWADKLAQESIKHGEEK